MLPPLGDKEMNAVLTFSCFNEDMCHCQLDPEPRKNNKSSPFCTNQFRFCKDERYTVLHWFKRELCAVLEFKIKGVICYYANCELLASSLAF